MSNVLITGGAGFIGSRLAARLVAQGDNVAVLDNLHPQVHSNAAATVQALRQSGITLHEGDIRDADAIARALERSGAEVVVHLAAETGTGQSFDLPARYCDTNVSGTALLIEAIRAARSKVVRVLLAGSRAVYGEGACVDAEGHAVVPVPREDRHMKAGDFMPKDREGRSLRPVPTSSLRPATPNSIYASTKLMQEYLLQQGFWNSGVDVGILRLQNVYGPGQSLNNPYTGVLSIFASQLMQGRQLNIFEDGEITRDFVYVDDVVDAFVRLRNADRCPSDILDVGTGRGVTILEVARIMLRVLGLPGDRVRVSGDYRPGDIRYAVADVSRAQDVLGWHARTSVDAGIEALLEWTRASTAPGAARA